MLESELYLVPFAVLRSGHESGEYLSERCSILTVPSLQTLRQKNKSRDPPENLNSALVVGGPRIPSALAESWGWSDLPTSSLQEAAMVSDMLHAKALVSSMATKEGVMTELPQAECVHFAANVSWKLGAIVLSPGDMLEPQSQSQQRFYATHAGKDLGSVDEDDTNDLAIGTTMEIPPLSDFMLSSADVLTMKLSAKLIVLSSYHSVEPISGYGVANLAASWLNAGAGAILISLWPVPETAAKILLRAFYSALLQGARAARFVILLCCTVFFSLFCGSFCRQSTSRSHANRTAYKAFCSSRKLGGFSAYWRKHSVVKQGSLDWASFV